MSERYDPRVGDRVKFTEAARRQKHFHGGSRADGRRRMTVIAVLVYDDVRLDDGEIWSSGWLELADEQV